MMYTHSLVAVIAATVAMLLVNVEAAPISASPESTACIAECITRHDKCIADTTYSHKLNKMVCDGLERGCEFKCKHFPTKPPVGPVVPVIPAPPTGPVVPVVPVAPTDPVVPVVPAPPTDPVVPVVPVAPTDPVVPVVPVVPTPPTDPVVPDVPAPPTVPAP